MAQIDQHAPGSFCWIELATSDQNAAKQFYRSLFGWTANDFPMGPGELYTMFQIEGCDAAAAYTLNAQMRAQGVPRTGCSTSRPRAPTKPRAKPRRPAARWWPAPFDVMDFGRMAVIQDPAGATFSVWESKSHKGTRVTGVPGTMCWADLSTPDPAGATAFYKQVFGWDFTTGQDDYLHIKNGEAFIGGIPPAVHLNPHAPPHWMTYFTVVDCDASAAQAKSSGANLYMGPMSIEKVGRMAVVADPQGAVFALFQPLPRE